MCKVIPSGIIIFHVFLIHVIIQALFIDIQSKLEYDFFRFKLEIFQQFYKYKLSFLGLFKFDQIVHNKVITNSSYITKNKLTL
jgi:hypothetical protein